MAWPCFPDEHYMLPPERRLGRVLELVDDGKYGESWDAASKLFQGGVTRAEWAEKVAA